MPFTTTASFDTAGRTMMGVAPAALVDFVATLAGGPLAVGGNCGVGASDLLVSVLVDDRGAPRRDRHRQGQLRRARVSTTATSTIPARPS